MNALITYHPYAKSAATDLTSRQQTTDIMERIRQENPSYWPYGLSIGHHDGGVYMIREASTREPLGFVGWQERSRGMRKIGYYSIGLLPEHRGSGYAREAVSKVIREKQAGVDEVRAMMVRTNEASRRLAESLGVEVEVV